MRNFYSACLLSFFVICSGFTVDHTPYDNIFRTYEVPSKIQRFFPNPATQFIQFDFDKSVDKSYKLEIYSFIGRKMSSSVINESKIIIYFNDNYYRGLYIFQLRDRTGRIVESGKFQVVR